MGASIGRNEGDEQVSAHEALRAGIDRIQELEREISKLREDNTELERRNQEMNRGISGLRRSYFEERAKVVRMEKGGR